MKISEKLPSKIEKTKQENALLNNQNSIKIFDFSKISSIKLTEILENIDNNKEFYNKINQLNDNQDFNDDVIASYYHLVRKTNIEDPIFIQKVSDIIKAVENMGDEALINHTNLFDANNYQQSTDLLVSDDEIKMAYQQIDKDLLQALKKAYSRIYSYHKKQLPRDLSYRDKQGIKLGNEWRAIENIAIYVPGGNASYPSSVLMSAVPAIVAGVRNFTIFTPAKNNYINPAILVAADLCNIKKIYKVGGASAIAAATFGTQTIRKSDKIVGPGNSFVAMAKKLLFGRIGIDMIAGPTDLTIIAEPNTNPDLHIDWLAIDALSQLEHGCDSKVFIIVDNHNYAIDIANAIDENSKKMSRKEIIKQSLDNSAIIVIDDIKNSHKIANFISPEHLQIITNNPQKIARKINNAGAIFLGAYSPEAIGDYIAGPSHTLPTDGNSRFSSGLSVFDFLKRISIIACNKKSFSRIADYAKIIAKSEGLDAHFSSISVRQKKN